MKFRSSALNRLSIIYFTCLLDLLLLFFEKAEMLLTSVSRHSTCPYVKLQLSKKNLHKNCLSVSFLIIVVDKEFRTNTDLFNWPMFIKYHGAPQCYAFYFVSTCCEFFFQLKIMSYIDSSNNETF